MVLLSSNPLPVLTLIIDNYDSYTYNIYQMVGEINGITPIVIHNDDFQGNWQTAWLWFLSQAKERSNGPFAYNVIISPGPGRPSIANDFGMCREAILNCSVPLFGICLGHQGIAEIYGGEIIKAKEVMHGRTSRVIFSKKNDMVEPFFAHVPNGFNVVRYHSLVVKRNSDDSINGTKIGNDLTILATTEDGIIMAIKHVNKPQYGVQFHPEAICSEYGYQIFQNFRDITSKRILSKCLYRHEANKEQLYGIYKHESHSFLAANQSTRMHSIVQNNISSIGFKPCHNTNTTPKYIVHIQIIPTSTASIDFAEYVYESEFRASSRAFWLDSSNFNGNNLHNRTSKCVNRFSMMGDSSGPLSYSVEYCVLQNLLRITKLSTEKSSKSSEKHSVHYEEGDILTHVHHVLRGYKSYGVTTVNEMGCVIDCKAPPPFEFRGGFVGYLGYEVLASTLHDEKETLGSHQIKATIADQLSKHAYVPDASLIFADRTIVFDHRENTIYAVSLSESSNLNFTRDWHRKIGQRCKLLNKEFDKRILQTSSSKIPRQLENKSVEFYPSRSREQYGQDIATIQSLIEDGETYEVCLTNKLRCEVKIPDPLDLYKMLRARNPAPYSALYICKPIQDIDRSMEYNINPSMDHHKRFQGTMAGSYALCCTSPERFLHIDKSRWMESKPIKGTRPRSTFQTLDETIKNDLITNIKDRAENMMITDLVRNDFGKVCEIGSVSVPSLMSVESYATVHQLVTTVTGRLEESCDAVDAIAATFPGGSMTGAPKRRTMEIIRNLEKEPRGPYSGSLGFFSIDGTCDLNIIIRTVVVGETAVEVGAGGAIVALSDTTEEYEEMLLKASALVETVAAFITGKTEGGSIIQNYVNL